MPYTYTADGRSALGLAQGLVGADYPLVDPDISIQYLLADASIILDNPRTADTTNIEYIPAVHIKWLYGLGDVVNTPPVDMPTPVHAVDCWLVDDDDNIVFDSTLADYRTWVLNDRLTAHEWILGGELVRLTVHTAWPVVPDAPSPVSYDLYLTPTAAEFDPSVVWLRNPRVLSLNALLTTITQADTVIFENGYNIELIDNGVVLRDHVPRRQIIVNANAGAGLGVYRDCPPADPVIRVLESAEPDARGNVALVAAPEYCYQVRPAFEIVQRDPYIVRAPDPEGPLHLTLQNDCTVCCDCDEMVSTFDYLAWVRDKYKEVGQTANGVRTQHEANITRWKKAQDWFYDHRVRAYLSPLACPNFAAGAQVCNQTPETLRNVQINLDFSTLPTSTFEVICNSVAITVDGSSDRYRLEGLWPNYYVRIPRINAYSSAHVRFKLRGEDNVTPVAVQLNVTATVGGVTMKTLAGVTIEAIASATSNCPGDVSGDCP
jgi:hypothetical protein